jgi:hypothetical protein
MMEWRISNPMMESCQSLPSPSIRVTDALACCRYINLSLNNIPAAGVLELKKAEEDHGDLTIQV